MQDDQDTRLASESVMSEIEEPSDDPLTGHPNCEVRFKRLEEQFTHVLGKAGNRAQRAGYVADASTCDLHSHLYDSHDHKEKEHEPQKDDCYGQAVEVQEEVRIDLPRHREAREGKDPSIESFFGLDPLDDLDLSGLADVS